MKTTTPEEPNIKPLYHRTQCQCCASPLGNRVCLDGTERIVCDKCLGFIARWWIELGEADKRPDKCPVPEQQGKTLMQLCEGGRL